MSKVQIKVQKIEFNRRLVEKEIVCRTMTLPRTDKVRELFRNAFKTVKDEDNNTYIKDHLFHISTNQTNYSIDKFKKDLRLLNKRVNQQKIHKRQYKKSPNRIVFFCFIEQSQDKTLTHTHMILRVPDFLKDKLEDIRETIEKYLPPYFNKETRRFEDTRFTVKLTKRTPKITRNYSTKKKTTHNDNFDVF